MTKCKTVAIATLLTILVSAASVRAGSATGDARLKSVTILIEESSAARQIADRGTAEARSRYEKAREHLDAARHSLNEGRDGDAELSILLATRAMLEAVRLADQEGVVEEIRRDDFEERLASVRALLDAHERVGIEKSQRHTVRELRAAVTRKVDRALALLDEQRVEDARELLDESYVAVKTAIEHLRGGETLVRNLSFANAEEEYLYEADRNDSHRILVRVLLEERMREQSVRQMVERHMSAAEKARSEGDRHAGAGDYAKAIVLLEASTDEMLAAIRSAGIYVPG